MEKYRVFVNAGIKRHKGSLFGIFLLIFPVSLALGTVITLWNNSGNYIHREMDRAGFGTLTAWVSLVPDITALADSISALEEVERVEIQNIIYSNYMIKDQESDSEGQLILYKPQEQRYRFFSKDLSGYLEKPPEIAAGEIYVSPSMISMFGIQIGDEITFPLVRGNTTMTFTVKGYYEDPFMGSSMIGMKGFLICENDFTKAVKLIRESGIDALARDGAMFHIFAEAAGDNTVSELNSIMNETTDLQTYAEFVHSEHAIFGFLLILQNSFSGLLLAFVLILLAATVVALSHNLRSGIESDFINMGILKAVGYTSARLRKIQLLQYLIFVFAGMLLGLIFVVPVSSFISSVTITVTGILIPAKLPILWCAFAYLIIFVFISLFIVCKTSRISNITPMKAIRGETKFINFDPEKTISIQRRGLYLRLAFRQLITGKRNYIGTCLVAVLLVFFASVVGRMDTWLGTDGKGMMDAFHPADHDIGIQIFGNLTIQEVETTIRSYTEITDNYLLAMPGVAVNGIDYTANVIDQPERFHILQGKSCLTENEVVLTEFVADDLGVEIGNTLTIRGNAGMGEYIVSGIYQCANDMGDNIGMNREGYLNIAQENPHIWCYHYFLADNSFKSIITETLKAAYGGDVHVHENSWPGLYGIIAAMQGLVAFMYGMVLLFTLIVTIMTGNRILFTEQNDMGIYKAIGFPTWRLRLTFALRFGIAAVLGSAIGIIMAAVLTDPLVASVMKLAGISNFTSVPKIGTILFPAGLVIFLFVLFAYFASRKIKKMDLTMLVAER